MEKEEEKEGSAHSHSTLSVESSSFELPAQARKPHSLGAMSVQFEAKLKETEREREIERGTINAYKCNGTTRPQPISFGFHAMSFVSCAIYIKYPQLSLSLPPSHRHTHRHTWVLLSLII